MCLYIVGETELKVQAIATPSAHKTFSRNKKAMAEELYRLFNHTVFDDQVSECVCVCVCVCVCKRAWEVCGC